MDIREANEILEGAPYEEHLEAVRTARTYMLAWGELEQEIAGALDESIQGEGYFKQLIEDGDEEFVEASRLVLASVGVIMQDLLNEAREGLLEGQDGGEKKHW